MRPLLAIAAATALCLAAVAPAAPEFAPNPRQAYEGFHGINPPRADVPVGALWINGYGPSGAGAGSDNLETVKSLSILSIDKNLQLELSLGLLNFLGIDPKARDHYTAHFSDLTIVRVKDISRLPGTKGEPRIVEALKAGTVAISSDSEIGLNGQLSTWQTSNVSGSTTNERAKTYSIEAHDMFIAIHVATPELTQSKEQELRLGRDLKSARIDDFMVVISPGRCAGGPQACSPCFGVAKINTQTAAPAETIAEDSNGEARLHLPVPTSDGQNGLFDTLALRWLSPCGQHQTDGCRREPRLFAHYEGTRLQDLTGVRARNW